MPMSNASNNSHRCAKKLQDPQNTEVQAKFVIIWGVTSRTTMRGSIQKGVMSRAIVEALLLRYVI